MEDDSPKPYLKKGGGVSGKYMKLIDYPLLRRNNKDRPDSQPNKSEEQVNEKTPSDGNSVNIESYSSGIDANPVSSPSSRRYEDAELRPITAGTVDSGCPEDEIVISPDTSKTYSQQTVACDVSDISNYQMNDVTSPRASDKSSGTFQSVVPDVASSVASAPCRLNGTVFDSTAEFELVEAALNVLNKSNATSLDSLPSSSLKAVEQKIEAQRNRLASEKDCRSEYSALSVPTLLDHDVPKVIDVKLLSGNKACSSNSLERSNFRERLRSLLDTSTREESHRKPLRESFPGLFEESVSTSQKKDRSPAGSAQSSNKENMESNNTDKTNRSSRRSWQIDDTGPVNTSNDLTPREQALAKQLRDLIVYLDVAFMENHQKNIEAEKIYSKVIESYAVVLEERNALLLNSRKLEEENRAQAEQCSGLKKSEELKMAEIKRLRRELASLRKQQKMSENEESEVIKLLKQQAKDLRNQILELERQLTDVKSQKRVIEGSLKERDKNISQLKEEKEKITLRLKALTDQKAEMRGRNAEEIFSQKAFKCAIGRAPVTAFSKRTTSSTEHDGRKWGDTSKTNVRVPASDLSNENEGSPVSNPYFTNVQQKTVHWNEPVASTASHSRSAGLTANEANMRVAQTEENNIGKATLYRGCNGDFVVHTQTFCKCNFYEYSNGDTRWIDSAKKYQVNYYAGNGATTAESTNGDLLIRHFLSGQLEIYRGSGEITLVTPSGKRIETVKQDGSTANSFRVEIYDGAKDFRVFYKDGQETRNVSGYESCFRSDGSYALSVESDGSVEFRGATYAVRRFKNGDVKIRLTEIDTSVSLLTANIGTVKHHNKPTYCSQKYCVEWGKMSRERSRRFHMMSDQYDYVGV